MNTDPIADYLTRVRNANSAGHRVVSIPASKLKLEITKILFDQGYITFDASGALLLSDECPPMIPIQWGFEDKIGERLIDVSVKRLKYIRYHNRYVFKR